MTPWEIGVSIARKAGVDSSSNTESGKSVFMIRRA